MPATLTPYRLYQIAKYAWAEYAFPSIHQAVNRIRPGGVLKGIGKDGKRLPEGEGGAGTAQGRHGSAGVAGDRLVSARALAPAGALVGMRVHELAHGSNLRDRRRSTAQSGYAEDHSTVMRGLGPRISGSGQPQYGTTSLSRDHHIGGSSDGKDAFPAYMPSDHPEGSLKRSPPPIPGSNPGTGRNASSPSTSQPTIPSSPPSSRLSSSRYTPPSSLPNRPSGSSTIDKDVSTIRRLLADSTLFTPDFKAPRNVVVLCHGLYGFSTATPIPLFPSLKLHYWHSVLKSLRDKLGCKVMVVGVNGTGSIEERANQMNSFLEKGLPKGTGVNFVAHSMGGLDCRYLITHLKPQNYRPLSLTMIGTPNRGSPFMDWCAANIGVGTASMMEKAATAAKNKLPPYSLSSPILSRSPAQIAKEAAEKAAEATAKATSSTGILSIPSLFGPSITNYLLGLLDHPAYGNLTTHFLNETFNPETPDDPNVKYTSTGGRISKMSVLHPLWFPKLILDAAAERGYAEEDGRSGKDYEGNDGLVSVSSAKWGEWMGVIDNAHHWDLRGEGGLWPQGGSLEHKPEGRPDPNAPGGWDWKAMQAVTEKADKKEGGAVLSIDRIDTLKKGAQAISDALDEQRKSLGKVAGNAKGALPDMPGSWDMAQVGHMVDWVGGLMPGTGPASGDGMIGEQQMSNARKEKAKQEAEADLRSSGTESWAKSAANAIVDRMDIGGTQTGEKGQRAKGSEERRKEKDKFEVGKFYGALMIKIREDGF